MTASGNSFLIEKTAGELCFEWGLKRGLFGGVEGEETAREDFLQRLVALDRFYREMGGLEGYQRCVEALISGQREPLSEAPYEKPALVDIRAPRLKAIEAGIEKMGELAEIYPVGGAADRLHLVEERTGRELPAAKLQFEGRSLLEGLMRDLIAREQLYEKKKGRKIVTPVALMTSGEKENHRHVLQICEEANWWGRPRELFRLFEQPLVPAVDQEGKWCWRGPFRPLWKPGGHGALWKLARDEGILEWLKGLGRRKALVRQINNPLVGVDESLLAFTGEGFLRDAQFGFLACPRLAGAAEGVLALQAGRITCVEYCDFDKRGIQPEGFPANLNLLFVDLAGIEEAVARAPYPGLLVNFKPALYQTAEGEKREGLVARLESTMQNIAEVFPRGVFIASQAREKALSPAKRAFVEGGDLRETPEQALSDLLQVRRELLLSCGCSLPPPVSAREMLAQGPSFYFRYHPAWGPRFADIRTSWEGGLLAKGADCQLEIARCQVRNLTLQGSLQIIAEDPLDAECILEDVVVVNRGVNWAASTPYWKGKWQRWECARIEIRKGGVCKLKGVTLQGNQVLKF